MSADNLHRVLARVPTADLLAAIARRGIAQDRAADVARILRETADDHDIDPALIMGPDRRKRPRTARWDLYARLEELGLCESEIAHVTGHNPHRVHYALKTLANA